MTTARMLAALTALERVGGLTGELSSGVEPTAGIVHVESWAFGAVASFEPLGTGDERVDVTCTLWAKQRVQLAWRQLSEFGVVLSKSVLERASEPRVLITGGLDFETEDFENHVLGVCGDLGGAREALVVVDDIPLARVHASLTGRFFCAAGVASPVEDGVEPAVELRVGG